MTRAEQMVRDMLGRHELGHAFLVEADQPETGDRVMEKLAQMIQCQEGTGCGHCASCRAFAGGNHPDIIRLSRAKESYGVAEIRSQLVDDIGIRPYSYPRKVYMIPQAERLSEICQNALLKTLEEPPAYGVILLSAVGRSALLPTVLSRLMILPARGELPTGEGISREARTLFAEKLGRMEYMDIGEIRGLGEELAKGGLPAAETLLLWETYIRDLYLARAGQKERLCFPEAEEAIRQQALRLSDEALGRLKREVSLAKERLKSNVNSQWVIEVLCLNFRQVLTEAKEL